MMTSFHTIVVIVNNIKYFLKKILNSELNMFNTVVFSQKEENLSKKVIQKEEICPSLLVVIALKLFFLFLYIISICYHFQT
jgi:hypothetical protein